MDNSRSASVRYSVVVRAYNEEKHIGRLLTGIMQQTVKNLEIILVDSGSTDATVAIATRYPVKVVYIRPEEFTFGYSLNQGIAAASGEIIVMASAHVYPVYPDWLERLFVPFENPQVALTYGKQRGNESSKFSENQIFARWFPDEAQTRQSHPFCNNANAAIRRSLWEEHPYDETLTGLEDIAWANWAIGEGHAIVYIPEAEIIHVHNETPKAVYNRYRREAMAFKQIFPDEEFHLWDFVRLFVTNAVSDSWHAVRARKLFSSLNSILWFRWMQFWGTYQGYRQSGPLTTRLRQTFYYPRGLRALSKVRSRDVVPIDYRDVEKRG
jgi:rhamnosyltransferase